MKEAMSDGLTALLSSLHENIEPFTDRFLSYELVQRLRTERRLEFLIGLFPRGLNKFVFRYICHGNENCSKKRILQLYLLEKEETSVNKI